MSKKKKSNVQEQNYSKFKTLYRPEEYSRIMQQRAAGNYRQPAGNSYNNSSSYSGNKSGFKTLYSAEEYSQIMQQRQEQRRRELQRQQEEERKRQQRENMADYTRRYNELMLSDYGIMQPVSADKKKVSMSDFMNPFQRRSAYKKSAVKAGLWTQEDYENSRDQQEVRYRQQMEDYKKSFNDLMLSNNHFTQPVQSGQKVSMSDFVNPFQRRSQYKKSAVKAGLWTQADYDLQQQGAGITKGIMNWANAREPVQNPQAGQGTAAQDDQNLIYNKYFNQPNVPGMNGGMLLDDPQTLAQYYWSTKRAGTQKSTNPLNMGEQQLLEYLEESRKKLNTATANEEAAANRTAEEQAAARDDTMLKAQGQRIFHELNTRGLPVQENMNGDLYVPDVEQWGGMSDTDFIRQRPDDGGDYGKKTDNDALLYDAIYGAGAYEARWEEIFSIEDNAAADAEADKLDAEMDELWQRLENGDFEEEEQVLTNEYQESKQNEMGLFGANSLQRQVKRAEEEQERQAKIAELEAAAPEGDGSFDESKVIWGLNQSAVDQVYYYANRPLTGSDFSHYGNMRPASFMLPEQVEKFNKYYRSGDKESAKAYYDALEPYLKQMQTIYKSYLEDKMSRNGYAPVMIANRVLTQPMAGVTGTIGTGLALFGNEDAQDPNSGWYSLARTNMNIQNARADVWGKQAAKWFGGGAEVWGQRLNGLVYSMADNIYAMALTGGAAGVNAEEWAGKIAEGALQFIMSSEATASTMLERLDAGGDPTESALFALGSGAIEWVTEKVSIEALLKPDVKELLGNPKELLKYLAKNAASEGTEEMASDVLGQVLDFCLSRMYGHESELEAQVTELKANNKDMSDEEAWGQVLKNFFGDVMVSGGMGALSGLALSGGRGMLTRFNVNSQNKTAGQNILNSGVNNQMDAAETAAKVHENLKGLIDAAGEFEPGTEVREKADALQKAMAKGKKPDAKQVGSLYRSLMQQSGERVQGIASEIMGDVFGERLTELGEAEENIPQMQEALTNLVSGNWTDADLQAIAGSESAQTILSEYEMDDGKVGQAKAEMRAETDPFLSMQEDFTGKAAKPQTAAMAARATEAKMDGWKTAEKAQVLMAGGKMTGKSVMVDGHAAEVTGVTRTEDGGLQVNFANGESEAASEVRAVNEGMARTLKYLENDAGRTVGTNLANALVDVGSRSKNATQAVTDAMSIMWSQALGTKEGKTSLSTKDANAIREAVRKDLSAAEAKRTASRRAIKAGQGRTTFKGAEYGSEKFRSALKSLDGNVRNEAMAIASIAKSAGFDVELYYDKGDTANQGSFSVSGGIRINLAGEFNTEGVRRSALATLSHEVTHWLEANSENSYKALRSFVVNNLQRSGLDVQAELNNIIETYGAHGVELDMSGAVAELVAKGCEQVLTNESVVQQLKEQDPTLHGKIKEAVKKLISRIRSALADATNTSSRYAKALAKYADELSRVWMETYSEAAGAQESVAEFKEAVANGDGKAANEALQHSLAEPVDDFSETMGMPIQHRKDGLVAMHNLSAERFMKALHIGGLAMPSTAVIPAGETWTQFSDVSLFFGRETVDPKAGDNRLFSGDAFTPMFSRDSGEFDSMEDAMEYLKTQPERMENRSIDSRTLIRDYTKLGDIDSGRALLYTYKNMSEEQRNKAWKDMSDLRVEALMDLEDYILSKHGTIEKLLGSKMTSEKYDEMRYEQVLDRALFDISENIKTARDMQTGENERAIIVQGLQNAIDQLGDKRKYNFKKADKLIDSIAAYINYAGDNVGSEWLEAKPWRPVGFSEVKEVLMPKNVSKDVVEKAIECGIPEERIKFYENEEERETLIRDVGQRRPDAVFSIQEQDRQYDAAVKSGDMETAQRMVDEAAMKAFPNSVLIQKGKFRKMWHHTSKEFTEFLSGKTNGPGGVKGIYFAPTDNGTISSSFGNIHKAYYLNVENVKLAEGSRSDDKYVDELRKRQEGITDQEELTRINREFSNETGIDAFIDFMNGWYTMLKPENIKSADPVTYDDNGNVIPLSERFRTDHDESWKDKDTRYSIQELPNGEKYVNVDTDQKQFNGLKPKEMLKLARKIIRDKFINKGNNVFALPDSGEVKITAESADEYSYPSKRNIKEAEKRAKAKASPELDNLIKISKRLKPGDPLYPNPSIGHTLPANVANMRYYSTLFNVGGRWFTGIINIEENRNKGLILKDITQINEDTSRRGQVGITPQSPTAKPIVQQVSSNKVTQNNNKGKTQKSIQEQDDQYKEAVKSGDTEEARRIAEESADNLTREKENINNITERRANRILKDNGEIVYAPAQYSFAGEAAEGTFGDDVREAYRMAEAGATDEEIRNKTNCIRGFNGRWWRVLDNNSMKLTIGLDEIENGEPYALKSIYDAKELYQAYPFLEHVPVYFNKLERDAVAETSGSALHTITYNTDYMWRGIEEIEATLQHEIQHIIQSMEFSNRGANVTFWKEMQDMARARIANNDREIEKIYSKYGIDARNELAWGIEFNADGTLDEEWLFPEELEKVKQMSEDELKLYKALDNDNKKWVKLLQGSKTPTSLYLDTVGEIEARAASEKTDENTKIRYPESAVAREDYTGEVTSKPGATLNKIDDDIEHLFGKPKAVSKFSMQENVEVNRDGLIAVHNLGEDQLIKTLKLGGFAMPSIAVIKRNAGHNKYGSVSVVFYPQTIDPKASKSNKVYGGDAWTPTYPTIEYKTNSKLLYKLVDKVEKLIPKNVLNGITMASIDETNTTNAINSARGDYVKALKNNLKLKLAYLADNGIEITYPMREKQLSSRYSNEEIRQIVEALGENTIREAYMNASSYMDEHPEIAETMRKIKADSWDREIKDKIGNKGTVLKMMKMNPYSKENWGYSHSMDGLQGAWLYIQRGITQEVDERALKEAVDEKLDEKGYEEWLRKELDGIIEKKGIRNNKDYYTNSGNPRSWEQLHDEETLENVVRVMKAQEDKGSNSFFSQSEMLAVGTRDFKSLEDIRKHSGQLKHMEEEEYAAAKENIINGFGQLMDELSDKNERNYLIARDRALEAMVDAVKRTRNPAAIERELRAWNGLNVREGMGQRIADLMQEIADLPTEYFEAKPKRAVGLDEIAKVIVPETASKELLNEMDRLNIPYEFYDGTDEGHIEALNRQEDAQFSIMDETDVDARAWMETVQESSLQTEAEKSLLRNFKALRMRVSLKQEQERKYRGEIARLEAIPEGERTREQKSRLEGYKVRLKNATTVKQQAEEELAKITSSNGYVSMMYRQQRVLNDFVYGRTQEEVRSAVERLDKSAENIEKRIQANREAAEALEKSGIVDRFRKLLGTTTADQTAAELKKAFNSTWTKGQIKTFLDPIITKMVAGEDFQQDVEELAGILVNSDSTNTYEELSGLRGLTITIGKGALAELRAQNSSLKEVRARLAGTGITVKSGERSTLEADIEDLRAEYPSMPELGDEKDALNNFLDWIDGMKQASAANEFYEQRLAEAMAVITGKAAGAAKGIYMPNDAKAQKQVLAMMDFVKSLNAETAKAQQDLQEIADDLAAMRKAGQQASGMANTMAHDANVALDYFNKMAKIAEDTAKQKTRKDLAAQLKSDFAAKIAKNNEEWRNLIARDRDARKQLETNRAYANRINTVLKRAYKRLKEPKAMKNVPEYMQGLAREMLGIFVDNDLAGGKRFTAQSREALTETRRVLDAWIAESGAFDRDSLKQAHEAVEATLSMDLMVIRDGIAAINSEIKGKNKVETLEKRGEILKEMQEAVSEIWSAVMKENQIFINGKNIEVEDEAYKIATQMGNRHKREWTGKLGGTMRTLHRAIVSGNLTPEYFFRTIGNAGMSDLWNGYHEAENRNGLELAKAKARLSEIAEKHGYSTWDVKQKVTLDLNSGAKVQMTIGQLMSLYATWKREIALGPAVSEHLAVGGFYAEQDLRDGLIGKTTVEHKAHRIAVERNEKGEIVASPDMQRVEGLLTEEQKQFVDEMVGFMSSDMSELGNEASMNAYGIKMYKEGYYFPFQMWNGIKSRKSNDSGSAAAAQDRAFHPSFSKSRLHGANNALMIGDFMQTVADHVAGMINYATMGLANENMQKAMNFQLSEEDGAEEINKRNVWTMFEEAYGMEAAQYLRELQQQLNGGAVKTSRNLGDKLISLFRKNAVAGSLSVALQQPMSYIRAAVMVNPKYLAAAMNPATWKGSYKEMMEHSGVAVIKDMGRFDMNFGQSAREYLMPEAQQSRKAKVWNGIEEYSTILPELMDRMTWTRMWSACKAEMKAQNPEMDVKSDEFLNMVGERFNDLMRRTQVYDSVLVKSANMRNDNYFIKSLTSFMAEPTLTLNVLADAARQAKSGEKGGKLALAKAGATFALSAVLQAAIKGLMGSGRTPDEKKTWEENFWNKFVYNFVSEIDPLQLIPGFSDMVTILKGGELKDDAFGTLSKLYKAGQGAVDILLGKSELNYRNIEDSAAQIAQLFTGVPAKNIMRDMRAMWNWVVDRPYADRETSGAVIRNQTLETVMNADNVLGIVNKWLGDAGYATDNSAYYKRIYDAKRKGNEKEAEDLIDYLLTGGKVKKRETIDSKVAALAKEDESTSAEEKADFLIGEGADADDFIRDQLRTGTMTAEEARRKLKEADPNKTDEEIWWAVDRVEFQIETGAEKAPSGNYYRLKDAISEGKSDKIRAAVKTMKEHGYDDKKLKSWIGSKNTGFKTAYLEAKGSEKVKIKNSLIMAYKAVGLSEDEANEIINKWGKDSSSEYLMAGRQIASGGMSDVGTGKKKTKYPELEKEKEDMYKYTNGQYYGYGNIDLNHRKVVHNPDGSISTEKSITLEYDGEYYILPTVINGKIVSQEEAKRHFKRTGEHLGVFDDEEEANEYAQMVHERQDWYYHR